MITSVYNRFFYFNRPMAGRILTGLLLILAIGSRSAAAQELDITVSIDRSQVENASLDFLDDFKSEIESYLNGYDWISEDFTEQERVRGQMQITLLDVDDDFNFRANVVVQSERPIYNSLRTTTLFLFNDENWSFNYSPNRQLVHDELQFDGVATLLDFYAFMILGFDFDSFSELGGTAYYEEAENLVSLAQTTSSTGWSRTSGTRRNRAQLVTDLLNPNYRNFRRAVYTYHRHGLDRFLDDPVQAREQVLQALRLIQESQRVTTRSFLFDTFFNAKYREIVSIFEEASNELRLEAYNLLSEIDSSHLNTYERLR